MTQVSEQTIELSAEFASLLERLQALVDNRSAWQDGIEGCRAALAMLNGAAEKLKAVNEAALLLEADLETSRAECKTWGANHAELSAIERQLRSECERSRGELGALTETRAERDGLRAAGEQQASKIESLKAELARSKKERSAFLTAQQDLRAECERLRATLEQHEATIASAQVLAKQLLNGVAA